MKTTQTYRPGIPDLAMSRRILSLKLLQLNLGTALRKKLTSEGSVGSNGGRVIELNTVTVLDLVLNCRIRPRSRKIVSKWKNFGPARIALIDKALKRYRTTLTWLICDWEELNSD